MAAAGSGRAVDVGRTALQLQATLPGGSPLFSNPLLFNNIFWDNRAGTRAGGAVTGLGIAGDADADRQLGPGRGRRLRALLAPTNSIVQQNAGIHPYTASPTNSSADPIVVAPYDVAVTFNAWRNNPAFLGAILVAADLPPNLMGNYHIERLPGLAGVQPGRGVEDGRVCANVRHRQPGPPGNAVDSTPARTRWRAVAWLCCRCRA